jgi:GntR family transcriptional regulator
VNLNLNSDIPIYLQIAEEIENAILAGVYEDETQVPSTTDISVKYKINPATVLKGFNKLVDERVLFKKRGMGMFVSAGARKMILEQRKKNFYKDYIIPVTSEAKKLSISKNEIDDMVKKGFEE